MTQKLLGFCIVLAALLRLTFATYNIQPLYQVSIMMELQPGNPIHICNGAIVYEKLIITTANCVHFKFGPKGIPNMLDPSALSILAGSTNAFTDVLRVNITHINIANGYNHTTSENDLALLTLSESLPLGTRPDMKWIMLDDNVHLNHSCLANFFSRNSNDAFPNYYQTEELLLRNNEVCRNETEYPQARKDDFCSIYVLPRQFDCHTIDSFLSFNNDRGTGIVCRSYLVGLLSSVVTRPDPKNNCSDVTLTALYTNIFPHLMWVYNIMAKLETEYISAPYDASVKSLVINSTQNSNKEFLTTTILPLTTANITTFSNSTRNSTTISPPTTWNSTLTNSTAVPPTKTPIQPFAWNATAVNSTTTKLYVILETASTTPVYSTMLPNPTPTIQNFLQRNSAPSVRFSGASLLIAFVSLRLIISH